jgi:hypothetical protein
MDEPPRQLKSRCFPYRWGRRTGEEACAPSPKRCGQCTPCIVERVKATTHTAPHPSVRGCAGCTLKTTTREPSPAPTAVDLPPTAVETPSHHGVVPRRRPPPSEDERFQDTPPGTPPHYREGQRTEACRRA